MSCRCVGRFVYVCREELILKPRSPHLFSPHGYDQRDRCHRFYEGIDVIVVMKGSMSLFLLRDRCHRFNDRIDVIVLMKGSMSSF
jgi:hypothetical protein